MLSPPPTSPVPSAPLWLGAGGLVPFVLLSGGLWVLPDAYRPTLLEWLRTYAAVILSFVGAVHWGIAMLHRDIPDRERAVIMGWSVVPALVAWVGLLITPSSGLTLIGAMFVIHYSMDRQVAGRFPIPGWYLRLRAGLTIVVVACIGIAAIR